MTSSNWAIWAAVGVGMLVLWQWRRLVALWLAIQQMTYEDRLRLFQRARDKLKE